MFIYIHTYIINSKITIKSISFIYSINSIILGTRVALSQSAKKPEMTFPVLNICFTYFPQKCRQSRKIAAFYDEKSEKNIPAWCRTTTSSVSLYQT